MPGRPVRRPNFDRHHARQPAQALAGLVRLGSDLRSGASASHIRSSPRQPAARSGSSSSSSQASSESARAASNSRSPRLVLTPTNGASPPSASPEASPRRRQNRGNPPLGPQETRPPEPTRANGAKRALVGHTNAAHIPVSQSAMRLAPTLIACLDDVAVLGETTKKCGRHLWVAEYRRAPAFLIG
jgi:hypothetical protein